MWQRFVEQCVKEWSRSSISASGDRGLNEGVNDDCSAHLIRL